MSLPRFVCKLNTSSVLLRYFAVVTKRAFVPCALCMKWESVRQCFMMLALIVFKCVLSNTRIECFFLYSVLTHMYGANGLYFMSTYCINPNLPILHHLEIYLYNFTCFEFWDFQSGFWHDFKLYMRKKLLIHIAICINSISILWYH